MTTHLTATEVDAGILEAIEALGSEQLAELQAGSAEAADMLRSMASCVELWVKTLDAAGR